MNRLHPLGPDLWLGLWLALLAASALANPISDTSLTLHDGTEIPIIQYQATQQSGKPPARLLLWIPSEFGLSPRQKPTAEALAKLGIEVWIPDLHSAYFIPPGRYSLNDIDPGVIEQLLEKAISTGRQVFVLARGRQVGLSLQAIRRYQADGQPTARLGGLIGMSANLYASTPQGGLAAQYLPIAAASNLPIYLIEPRNSASFWRIGEVADELRQGGSPVFVQWLNGVGNAFNLRDHFTPAEVAMTQRLPAILDAAMSQLSAYPTPARPAPLGIKERAPQKNLSNELLTPYPGNHQAPPLNLQRLDGSRIDLARLRGKVVLVNFWATWCPPCVEEIPSLQRLYQARHARGLDILAVDVGETREQMRRFLADKPVDFPVLLDPDGVAFKRWDVHAFPTTLILDRSLRIRYAVFGAFAWDSPEVLKKLEPLLDAKAD